MQAPGLVELAGHAPDVAIGPLAGLHRLAKRRFWQTVRRQWRSFLRLSERWSEAELQAWQLGRLQEVVHHAATTVPYYRRACSPSRA